MNVSKRLFLRAEHWQLFLPAFAYGVLGDLLIARTAMKVMDPLAALREF